MVLAVIIPANEPVRIMPGKVNPTQCEALTMIAAQVFGNDATIGLQHRALTNVFNPVLVYNLLQSIRLLADGCSSFNDKCAVGIDVNRAVIEENLNNSLMLVTALNPHIGYDNAAKIAKKHMLKAPPMKEAAVALQPVNHRTV